MCYLRDENRVLLSTRKKVVEIAYVLLIVTIEGIKITNSFIGKRKVFSCNGTSKIDL